MEDDRNSLDRMLDELEKEGVRKGEEDGQIQGSEVYLNVYDMVGWLRHYFVMFLRMLLKTFISMDTFVADLGE